MGVIVVVMVVVFMAASAQSMGRMHIRVSI